jgi:1-phosphatidylinositol-3-phosphate 5-kinase
LQVKILIPKRFEALRRFYCGSHHVFLQSMISSKEWNTVTDGKTKSKFHKSFDDMYVVKEIKKSKFKMFLEFAPSYFTTSASCSSTTSRPPYSRSSALTRSR